MPTSASGTGRPNADSRGASKATWDAPAPPSSGEISTVMHLAPKLEHHLEPARLHDLRGHADDLGGRPPERDGAPALGEGRVESLQEVVEVFGHYPVEVAARAGFHAQPVLKHGAALHDEMRLAFAVDDLLQLGGGDSRGHEPGDPAAALRANFLLCPVNPRVEDAHGVGLLGLVLQPGEQIVGLVLLNRHSAPSASPSTGCGRPMRSGPRRARARPPAPAGTSPCPPACTARWRAPK